MTEQSDAQIDPSWIQMRKEYARGDHTPAPGTTVSTTETIAAAFRQTGGSQNLSAQVDALRSTAPPQVATQTLIRHLIPDSPQYAPPIESPTSQPRGVEWVTTTLNNMKKKLIGRFGS